MVSYSYAENAFTLTQNKSDDKSFLEVFTEEEKCIILAFEHQLDVFGGYYKYHHKAMIETAGDIELWDVGSLYWNSTDKSLDGFLEYIVAPSRKHMANAELNEAMFKEKVWKDYVFVKEVNRKKKEQENEELFNLAYDMYVALYKFINSSKGIQYIRDNDIKLNLNPLP